MSKDVTSWYNVTCILVHSWQVGFGFAMRCGLYILVTVLAVVTWREVDAAPRVKRRFKVLQDAKFSRTETVVLKKTIIQDFDHKMKNYINRKGPVSGNVKLYFRFWNRKFLYQRWNNWSNWIKDQLKQLRRKPSTKDLIHVAHKLTRDLYMDGYYHMIAKAKPYIPKNEMFLLKASASNFPVRVPGKYS